MTSDMSGKTVVVTGAVGGVLSGLTPAGRRRRATLVLGDLNAVALEDLAGSWPPSPRYGVDCDVTSVPADIENLMAEAAEAPGVSTCSSTLAVWSEGPTEPPRMTGTES